MSARTATLHAHPIRPGKARTSPAVQTGCDAALAEVLLTEARHGILVVNEDMSVRLWNKAFARMYPESKLRTGTAMNTAGLPEEMTAAMSRAISIGQRTVVQLLHTSKGATESGSYHRIETAPLASPDARGGGWLIAEDITEQIQTEQIRKDFVTNASHELRTPLALIHGYIETLQSGMFKGSTSIQRCLEVMDKHSRRMMRIIEDMLTISRLESADSQLQYEPFSVRSCVEDVLEHLTPLIDLRQPHIDVRIPATGILHGDRFYWDQIFTNLIENAIKENPEPGLQVCVTGEWTASETVLRVIDNGVGIPAEDLPFVFKRFFRCAKHHSQDVKGTGLGLSIVRRAVEAHGGKISVQSEPRVRTEFLIRIPIGAGREPK